MKRVFVLSFLCLLGAAGRAVAAPVPDNSIDSIVKIYVVDLYGRPESWGSGVILDAQGDILTNFHVLDEAMSRPGWSWRVFPTAGAKSAPVQGAELRTTLVGTAPHLDLALLRATHVRNADGSYTDFREHFARGARRVPHVAFDRHAHDYGVTLGEEIHVLGYPGAGDYSITYTKGTVSGFVQRDFDGVSQPWQLKTDAKLNHGNSGGAAFDAKENFIGVPSEIHSDQSGMDYMGYIIPLPVVDYFLDQQLGGETVAVGPRAEGGLGVRGDGSPETAPAAAPVPPRKQGSLSKQVIGKVIKSHWPEIKGCYEPELAKTPSLQGRVDVALVISATGAVDTAAVKTTTLNNQVVESCMIEHVKGWRFPTPKHGPVYVDYPWVFRVTGGEPSSVWGGR